MTCYKPIKAWTSPGLLTKNGKKKLFFEKTPKLIEGLSLPCGQCIGCRLDRSRQWATKVSLENQMHDKSIFCTLTYDDDHVPYIVNPDTGEMLQTLKPEHFTKFIKNLRRQIDYHFPNNPHIRFFGCGEYGDKSERPHYHIIIFGFEPEDKKHYKTTFRGDVLYNSDFLSKCWPYGFLNFGSVTFESAAYVARYVTKKITGEMAEEHYQGRCPEFVRMSRRPGIGKFWFDKYKDDVYPQDFIVIRDGIKVRPPKYFDKLYEKYFPDGFARIRDQRMEKSADMVHKELLNRDVDLPDYGIDRVDFIRELESYFYEHEVLPVKETVKEAQFELLKRPLEGDI